MIKQHAHAVIIAIVCLFSAAAVAGAATEKLRIETRLGVFEFNAEIADTPEERRRGLMFRTSLAADTGMLFNAGREQVMTMWMRNTKVSLDMIFIQADGRVATVAERTEPFSLKIISSGVPVIAVFEAVAGTARRIGLKAGDRVYHRYFPR